MQVPSLKRVYSFPTRSLSNYRLDCVHMIHTSLGGYIYEAHFECHDILMSHKMETSRHGHCCSLGSKASIQTNKQIFIGGPRGRVVKVTDFSALNHSIISPLWVRPSLGARVTCGTSQVLLAGVSGGFSPGTPVFAPPND